MSFSDNNEHPYVRGVDNEKIVLSSLFLSASTLSVVPPVQADTHSVSLGYAQSRIEHFKDIRGVNLKYRYEAEMPVGLMASFSWQSGKHDESGGLPGGASWHSDVKAKYWSLLAGPSLRINEFVSLYALEQALWARRPSGTIHHSDKGSQYVSLAYTERLKKAKLLALQNGINREYR